jgi:hypothetical protein
LDRACDDTSRRLGEGPMRALPRYEVMMLKEQKTR